MIKKGVTALAGAASLLFGSAVATAQTSAASLSLADPARAGAPMADASAQGEGGLSPVLIGVGIFVIIVAGFYFLAESDDPPVSA